MKKLTYKIGEDCIYYPLRLNNNVTKHHYSEGNIPIKLLESVIDSLFEEISEEYYYIIDFNSIDAFDFKKEHYDVLLKKNCALLDVSEKLYKAIKDKSEAKRQKIYYKCYDSDETKKYFIYYDSGGVNHLGQYLKGLVGDFEDNCELEFSLHKKIVAQILTNYLKEKSEFYSDGKWKYLESSNIYINCYINVKHLFWDFNMLRLVISELINNIAEIVDGDMDRKDIYLLGVSNNGIILSRILSYIINWPTKNIYHVGPRYCLDNISYPIEELSNKKYILVSDVFCLGTEYRVTKGMVHILSSELLGAISVVKIIDIYQKTNDRKDKILSIVDGVNNYGLNYKMKINP